MRTFLKLLIAAWLLFWLFVAFVVAFPKLATRIPHFAFVRPYMIVLFIASVTYGVLWLYRQGMRGAKSK